MNRRDFGWLLGGLAMPGWRRCAMGADPRVDRFGDPLPGRAVCRFGTIRFWSALGGPGQEVTSIAVSPDGRLVATAGIEPPIVLWDLATGREVRRLGAAPPDDGAPQFVVLHDIAFTPDGSVLAAARPDGKVERWEVATGKPLEPFTGGHRLRVCRLAFARNGTVLATGGEEGLVLVRDPATGAIRHRLGPHEEYVALLAVSDDGRTVISAGWHASRVVSVWDAATGRLLRELEPARFGWDNHAIALAPDGTVVAVGRGGYEIIIWDVRTGKIVAELEEVQDQAIQEVDPHEVHDEVPGLAFSPDGKTLASAGRDGSVRLWDVATWSERVRLDWHGGDAQAVAFSPDGATLLAAGSVGVIRAWSLPEGRERIRTTGHRAGVSQLAWTPDGKSVVSLGRDGAACVIDPVTGEQVKRTVILPRICYASDLSPDGRLAAFQGLLSDRRISVVEAATGRMVREFDHRGDQGGVLTPCFSADAKMLFVGDGERHDERYLVVVYDIATGKEIRRVVLAEYFDALVTSPDGRSLAAKSLTGEILICDGATGRLWQKLRHPRKRPGSDVSAHAFSPDGAILATAGGDGNVILWDVVAGRAVRSLGGHRDGAFRVAFSPDGKILASAAVEEPLVRLWQVASGREVGRLEGHRATVTCLSFAPDGRRLVTGSLDTTVLVWDLAGG